VNEYLNKMFPDKDHLRHFPDDANSDRPEERRSRRGPAILCGVRPWFLVTAVIIVLLICVLAAVLQGCGSTRVDDRTTAQKLKQKEYRMMRNQHGDMSKTMREFRFNAGEPGVTKSQERKQ
jgi:hypothetical protein